MKLLRGCHDLLPLSNSTVATIGNYDGFHIGHQKIVEYVNREARTDDLPSALISFQPSPKEYFERGKIPARIYSFRKKFQLAESMHLDYFACLRFNKSLATMPAENFVREILVHTFKIKKLIVGDDFRFGYQRQGDFELLSTLGESLGFSVININTLSHEHTRISSSLVREKLAQGDLAQAAILLGRPFTMSGHVFHGDKKGRTIGFPTANIFIRRRVSPIHGVFTVSASDGTSHWQGVANVGRRPTVNGQRMQLEVHMFNCDEILYGKRLTVEFHTKIRDEIKFSSFEALRHQISLDAEQARQYFSQRT